MNNNDYNDDGSSKTCFDLPATRDPEVLALFEEIDPLSHPDSERRYRERVGRFCENLMWRRITGDVNPAFVRALIDRTFTAAEVIDEIPPETLEELKFQICALYFKKKRKKSARDHAEDRLENGAPEDHSLN